MIGAKANAIGRRVSSRPFSKADAELKECRLRSVLAKDGIAPNIAKVAWARRGDEIDRVARQLEEYTCSLKEYILIICHPRFPNPRTSEIVGQRIVRRRALLQRFGLFLSGCKPNNVVLCGKFDRGVHDPVRFIDFDEHMVSTAPSDLARRCNDYCANLQDNCAFISINAIVLFLRRPACDSKRATT